jgi:hypothetical protein
MKTSIFCAAMAVASPVLAQDTTGFYVGGNISHFDTEFESYSVSGDGSALGIHFGYRHAVTDALFFEGEVAAASLDGATSSGLTNFEHYTAATVGIGGYLTEGFSIVAFAGAASVATHHNVTGRDTDSGAVYGIGLNYDISEHNNFGLRLTKAKLDGDLADVNSDMIGLRFTHRF